MAEKRNPDPVLKLVHRATYEIQTFIGWIYRTFAYRTDYFFDTNFIITKHAEEDLRLKKLYLVSKNFFVTEFIDKEIREKLESGEFKERCTRNYEIVSFNSLFAQAPICPVYYNFLGLIHNPANIASDEFFVQLAHSVFAKNRKITPEMEKILMMEMGRLARNARSELNPDGSKKREEDFILEEAGIRNLKKRKEALKGKNKNYLNDLRNMAAIFTHATIHRRNVTFITSDSDAVALFFDWASGVAQQMTFSMKVIPTLNQKNKKLMRKLVEGKKVDVNLQADELVRFIQGTTSKFYGNRTKYFAPRLSIRYWDKNTQKFYEVGANLDFYSRELLLHLHGQLNCPTARNDLMGAFIGYRYYWPPKTVSKVKRNLFKLKLSCKKIYEESVPMDPSVHDYACLYRRQDSAEDLSGFSSFT